MIVSENFIVELENSRIEYRAPDFPKRTTDFVVFSPSVIVFPKDVQELVQVVSLLSKFNRTYHVVSRGNNWGYGDENVNSKTLVLINLKHINRIHSFNQGNGTVTIEPGVSQGQLADFLKDQNSNWVLDITGANRDASVVGNCLERGFGHTSHGDHGSMCKAIEVLTPEGKLFCPHLTSSGPSKVIGLYQHDISLNMESVFYQTNFGIVTKALVKLKPKNHKTQVYLIAIESDTELENCVQELGRLKSEKVIISVPHIASSKRVSGYSQSKNKKVAEWVVTIDISGDPLMVRARKKILSQVFKKQRRLSFSQNQVYWFRKIIRLLPTNSLVKNQIEKVSLLCSIYSGTPVDDFVTEALGKIGSDGLKKMNWLCPLIPIGQNQLGLVKHIISEEFEKYNFTYAATLSLVADTCCVMIVEIIVDSLDVERVKFAEECYKSCHEKLYQNGFPFYRYGFRNGQMLGPWLKENPEYLRVYKLLKSHFDPKNLLSPGRWGI